MISPLKKVLLLAAFLVSALPVFAQPDISAAGILNKLNGLVQKTPKQTEDELLADKFKIVSQKTQKLSLYDAVFTKFRMDGQDDDYTIISVKERVVNAIYITYNKDLYNAVMAEAANLGYHVKETNEKQTVYALDMKRIVTSNAVKASTGQPFFTISLSDLATVEKAIQEAKQ